MRALDLLRQGLVRLGPEARQGLLGLAALFCGFWVLAALLRANPVDPRDTVRVRDLPQVRSEGPLRIGMDPTSGTPYCVEGSGAVDDLTGFEPDMARAVGKRLKVEVAIQPMPWGELRRALVEGQIDLALNALEIKDGQGIRFTKPYYTGSQAIVVPASLVAYDLEGLAGRRVGALKGSVAEAILRRLHPPARVEAFADALGPFRALQARKVEAVLAESAVARAWLTKVGKGHRIVGRPVLPRPYGVAVRATSPALLAAVNDAITSLKVSGEQQAILQRHGIWEPLQAPGKGVSPVAAGPMPSVAPSGR